MTTTYALPLTETISPADQSELVSAVKEAAARTEAIYPLGGGTSLEYGLPGRMSGIGLATTNLTRVVDYPARDMTITVEAGITMEGLKQALAAERQWLPIDAPHPEQATLGGVVATAWNGPRRYGWGTIRDYVIGISAVDGRGTTFKGGGRVVKNVAGYDFCKLLTGSLGTLGVITQVTLKIKPLPERSILAACEVANLEMAEKLLAALVNSGTTPAAIELLVGPGWNDDPALGPLPTSCVARLVVGLEGTADEVDWMGRQIETEWRKLGVTRTQFVKDAAAGGLWTRLRDFPAIIGLPLVIKASVRPSDVTPLVGLIQAYDAKASIQSHAGNGIVIARFEKFDAGDVSRWLIGKLQPMVRASGGNFAVLSSSGLGELTHQAAWGSLDRAGQWMQRVKQSFDPQGLFNPGRFVYPSA